MQKQVREQRHHHVVEERPCTRAGPHRGRMARRAADRPEHLLAGLLGGPNRPSCQRRKETHEGRKVVDAAAAGARVAHVFWIRKRIAQLDLLWPDAKGDLGREEVIGDAPYVIDLAFSFGDSSWEYLEQVGIGGARNVAESCLRKKVKRLIYTSTIGVLDMSSPNNIITDATGPDPQFATRDPYSKFKSICEHFLLEMHREKGLNVCIFRPGLVIGEEGNPYHSGVAKFYNKQHATCLGDGTHPLPFVLVTDTAEAYYLALTKPGIDGKSFNLVGDVRLTAREYVAELSNVLERPIKFVRLRPWQMKSTGVLRWILKMACGRFESLPNFHDMNCAGLYGYFDNQEVKQALGWQPVTERTQFLLEGIAHHRKIR
mgnify:CR=1 FL=1